MAGITLFHILKYNPHHEPAGSPKGGRFAKKPGASSSEGAASSSSNEPAAVYGGSYSRSTFQEAIDDVLKWNSLHGEEKAVFISPDGSRASPDIEGDSGSVTFPPTTMDDLTNPANNITVVHNHPGGRSLSVEDYAITSHSGVRAIMAVGDNGCLYHGKLSPKFIAEYPSKEVSWTYLREAFRYADIRVREALGPRVNMGQVELEDANLLHYHVVNLILSTAKIVQYAFEDSAGALKQAQIRAWEDCEAFAKSTAEDMAMSDFPFLGVKVVKMTEQTDKVVMIIDPPVGPYSPRNELMAWKDQLQSYPDCDAKYYALEQVASWLGWKSGQ